MAALGGDISFRYLKQFFLVYLYFCGFGVCWSMRTSINSCGMGFVGLMKHFWTMEIDRKVKFQNFKHPCQQKFTHHIQCVQTLICFVFFIWKEIALFKKFLLIIKAIRCQIYYAYLLRHGVRFIDNGYQKPRPDFNFDCFSTR